MWINRWVCFHHIFTCRANTGYIPECLQANDQIGTKIHGSESESIKRSNNIEIMIRNIIT